VTRGNPKEREETMKLKTRAHRRWVKRLALGLALAAIAAPSAQADVSPSREQPVAAEFPTWPINWNKEPVAAEFPMYPINWAQPRHYGAPEFPTWPINWAQPATEAPGTPVSVPGFDYRDAGIGAAIALGVALLTAAGFLALRRNRRTAGLA
jgi:hypothetical protein